MQKFKNNAKRKGLHKSEYIVLWTQVNKFNWRLLLIMQARLQQMQGIKVLLFVEVLPFYVSLEVVIW